LPYYELEGKIAVVIDVFRASSAICAGLHNGVALIIPVASFEQALSYQKLGYKVAAEREGQVVKGFDYGNSPIGLMDQALKGHDLVLTTSNGTDAIEKSLPAKEMLVGGFVNSSAIKHYLAQKEADVILICAGWKNRFNLEDSLFAGQLIHEMEGKNTVGCDGALAAEQLYLGMQNNVKGFLKQASHFQRLKNLGIEEDIDFCLSLDKAPVVPYYNGISLTVMEAYQDA